LPVVPARAALLAVRLPIFAVQDEIAKAVVEALKVKLFTVVRGRPRSMLRVIPRHIVCSSSGAHSSEPLFYRLA